MGCKITMAIAKRLLGVGFYEANTRVRYAKVARTPSDCVDRSERHILGSERESGEITPRTTSPRGAYGIGRQIHSHTAGSPYCLS